MRAGGLVRQSQRAIFDNPSRARLDLSTPFMLYSNSSRMGLPRNSPFIGKDGEAESEIRGKIARRYRLMQIVAYPSPKVS